MCLPSHQPASITSRKRHLSYQTYQEAILQFHELLSAHIFVYRVIVRKDAFSVDG